MTKDKNDSRSQPDKSGNEVHHALIDVLLEDGGLNEVADALAAYVGRPVLIANVAGAILVGQPSAAGQAKFSQFMHWVARHDARDEKSLRRQAQQLGLHIAPLIVQGEVEGLLVVEVSEDDQQTPAILEQGATVVTLALIKHHAVRTAEQRLQRDMLEELLTNKAWSEAPDDEQIAPLATICFTRSLATLVSTSATGLTIRMTKIMSNVD